MQIVKQYNEKTKVLIIKNLKLDEETITELYQQLIDKKCSFMIIKNKNQYNILTKEKSILTFNEEEKDKFIEDYLNDEYYETIYSNNNINNIEQLLKKYYNYLDKYKITFEKKYAGYLFGTVAVRINENSFIITIRGKKDLTEYSIVENINHDTKQIILQNKKAAPNAPLMDYIFKTNSNVDTIVMLHHMYNDKYKTLPYYPSGTYRDSIRDISESINIDNHGSILLFDKEDNIIEKRV